MKTFIAIITLLAGTVGVVLTKTNFEDHRSCSCSGALCSCDATCLDHGEIPSCTCSALTCICKCTPKDANNVRPSLPTMNADQLGNSLKSEKYFRNLNTSNTTSIADGIKELRESIQAGDPNRYHSTALNVEGIFSKLTASQVSAWEAWSNGNLKK